MESPNSSTQTQENPVPFSLTGKQDEDYQNAIADQLASDPNFKWDDEGEEEESEETPAETPEGTTTETQETPTKTEVAAPAVTEEAPKASSFDETDYLDKLTGGRAKTKQEVEMLLAKKDLSKYPELEKAYEHFENRGTFETFNKIRQIGDINEMPHLDAIRKEIEVTRPELTPSEIDLILAKRYPSDEERFEEDDIKTGQAQLKLDGPAAKERLSKIVEDLKIPQAVKQEISTQEQLKKAAQDWGDAISEEAPKLTSINLDFPGDTEPFVFEIPKEDIADLTDLAKELYQVPKLANRLAIGPDGKFNMPQLLKAIYLSEPKNFQKVVSAYGANGKARGIEEIKKTIKNENEPGGRSAGEGVQNQWETIEEGLARSLNG